MNPGRNRADTSAVDTAHIDQDATPSGFARRNPRRLRSGFRLGRAALFLHAARPRRGSASPRPAILTFATLAEAIPEAERAAVLNEVIWGAKHRNIIRRFGRFPHRNA